EIDRKIAGAEHHGRADRDEVAGPGEIDLVLDPDAGGGRGDQPEQQDREPADHRTRDRQDQRAEFRGKSQHDREQRRYHEDLARIDLGDRHDPDVFRVGGYAGAAAAAG